MDIADIFPIWDKLEASERDTIAHSAVLREVAGGTVLHSGSDDCLGLLIVRSGQLRAFMISDEGREMTLYRLFERDMCLFSASCIMNSIRFDITIEAEKDSKIWVIPADIYKKIMENSAVLANYTNQIMASRFSEVMWLIEQIMWKRFDQRLAAFLVDECAIDGGDTLKITHEKIAAHMGTAREVVTRMLKYLQSEGLVSMSRGYVRLVDMAGLEKLAE